MGWDNGLIVYVNTTTGENIKFIHDCDAYKKFGLAVIIHKPQMVKDIVINGYEDECYTLVNSIGCICYDKDKRMFDFTIKENFNELRQLFVEAENDHGYMRGVVFKIDITDEVRKRAAIIVCYTDVRLSDEHFPLKRGFLKSMLVLNMYFKGDTDHVLHNFGEYSVYKDLKFPIHHEDDDDSDSEREEDEEDDDEGFDGEDDDDNEKDYGKDDNKKYDGDDDSEKQDEKDANIIISEKNSEISNTMESLVLDEEAFEK